MIVAVVNNVPAWGGIIWKTRWGTSGTIELGCASIESYLDWRYTGTLSFTQADEASGITAGLVAIANSDGIDLAIEAPPTGTLRDRSYFDDENATVYQRLTELMDVEGGPEWTIDLRWADPVKQDRVIKVFRCAKRIGSTVPKGPLSTLGKAKAAYSYTLDHSRGMGANDVLAYSSGEGEDRPESIHAVNQGALNAGEPRLEHRFSPSSSIKNIAVLNSHAASRLALIDGGTESLDVTARWDTPPARLGVDLLLGDQVGFELYSDIDPTGRVGTARMVAWKLDTGSGTFNPTLRIM